MHSFCWNVLSIRSVYEKLVAELVNAPLSEPVQFTEGLSLPYFQACLKEAMRLQPALATSIIRQVPSTGAEIDGVFIPGNTHVSINAWVLQRDRTVFGADAEVYNPDRWFTRDENALKRMERCMFQVSE